MRWLARWARRMADVIDPPEGLADLEARLAAAARLPRKYGPKITVVTAVNSDGLPFCPPCDRHHESPVHYHTL